MSSITLNRIIDQCTERLLISASKKNPSTLEAAHGILDLAWDAYEHKKRIEPLGSGFIVSGKVKSEIVVIKGELDRLLPICEKISILAIRQWGRNQLDLCSKMAIGLAGVSLLVPIDEESPVLTSRPAIFVFTEAVAAYAIQVYKDWQLPNRGAERVELGRLWMELDGKIPANIEKASDEMRVQVDLAKAMVNYASIRFRVEK